jgi:hypothetical protein
MIRRELTWYRPQEHRPGPNFRGQSLFGASD